MIPENTTNTDIGGEQEETSSSSIPSFTRDIRGQTFFDFVIGITLFLFIVLFVVFFIPDLIDPFEPSADASTVLADRGADHLTQNVLREQGQGPYVLNTACTVALFNGNAPDQCNVNHADLVEIVGMNERSHAHAEIVDRDGNVIQLDGVELSYGDNQSETTTGDVYTSTRIVTIEGERYRFVYSVW